MKARFSNASINSDFFNYLKKEQIQEIKNRIEDQKSVVISFEENEYTIFCAVLDLDDAVSLHVREVCGNFLKHWKNLDIYCEGLARFLKKSEISFNTARNAVMRVSGLANYSKAGDCFVRAVA